MQKFIQSAENLINWISPAAWVIVAVALTINAILMMTGGEEGRQKAKKALPWVALGCIIFLLAVDIGKEIVGNIVL